MRVFCFFSFLLVILVLSNCKKYDEGGWVSLTRKHLFGGNDVGDSKTWKLKKYEVNGIDSTYSLTGGNSIPDFYNKHITFKLTDRKLSDFVAESFLYHYNGSAEQSEKALYIGLSVIDKDEDSTQCKTVNNTLYCGRNIFAPEYKQWSSKWEVKKLTKSELILIKELKNSYKIILVSQ